MKILPIVFAILVSVSLAQANVGENQAAIEKRYGKSSSERVLDDHQIHRTYSSKGLKIIVIFLDGVSQAETYGKENNSQLSESEITALLDKNSRGEKWIEAKHPDLSEKMWKLGDEVMVAGYNETDKKLYLFTRAMTEHNKKQKAQDAGKTK